MRPKFLVPLLALAATPAAAVSDFRLPADQPTQQPPPDLQGPVAPDVPASRRPPPTPTPSPSASRAVSPAPTAAPPPIEVPSGIRATPAARPPSRTATPGGATTLSSPATGAPPPEALATESAVGAAPATPAALPTRESVVSDGADPADEAWSWLWLLATVPLLAALVGVAAWALRRRVQRPAGPVIAPRIERPRPGHGPASPRPASPAVAERLQVSLEPLRLSLTLVNATLAYRLELANRGPAPLTGLAIGADMISAHASMSREEQLSGPRAGSGGGQRIERLEPGESRIVEGEFRLPFPQIVPIRQGSAALLLPLARFRVEADGAGPVIRTFVVGQPGQGNGLQPFRLDQGPRVYPRLAQHAFA